MSDLKPDSPLTGSTSRLVTQTEGWTPEQYCAKWAALERELATLRERLAEAEQRAERAEQDAERMEAIEKHGLKIVTDFVIDSLVAGRTFGSVRELFDAAIAARSAT